jgi:acetyltransferase-like isoleucine patch superfamily enzyme
LKKDHRPYFIKKSYLKFQRFYVNHFLRPHFESLGKGFNFMRPWHVEIFGSPVSLGDYATVIAAPDKKIRLSVWSEKKDMGRIHIGSFCIICPGVRISSASDIRIGDNCMIASGSYITDSDWHDIYDRVSIGRSSPVKIENNVWIGDSVIVCKGVAIGENSIIGAGSVVVSGIPPNSIAAGNPAKVIKHLDANEKIIPRESFFSDPAGLSIYFDSMDRAALEGNTFFHWLRYILFPRKGD